MGGLFFFLGVVVAASAVNLVRTAAGGSFLYGLLGPLRPNTIPAFLWQQKIGKKVDAHVKGTANGVAGPLCVSRVGAVKDAEKEKSSEHATPP